MKCDAAKPHGPQMVMREAFAGTIPCDNAVVREAIDRGVPLDEIKASNVVTRALKKLVLPQVGSNQVAGKFTLLSEKITSLTAT